MENTFNKVRSLILENGNSSFLDSDQVFSTKVALETANTMLLLEENDENVKITMSFFELFDNTYCAFRIDKNQNTYKLIGETFENENFEITDKKRVLKVFKNESFRPLKTR